MLTSPTSSRRLAFSVPGQPGNTHPVPDPVAVVGDVAYLLVSAAECGGAPSRALVAHDVVSGATGSAHGPGVDAGTVGPVALIEPGRWPDPNATMNT